MIGITTFLLASYLMMAISYTIASWLDIQNCPKYWFLIPVELCLCLWISWFYFPLDVGFKLYKKLNEDEEKEKR